MGTGIGALERERGLQRERELAHGLGVVLRPVPRVDGVVWTESTDQLSRVIWGRPTRSVLTAADAMEARSAPARGRPGRGAGRPPAEPGRWRRARSGRGS